MKPKYFLYARKSTEDEERQMMSIEAQITELAQFAKREKLQIVEKFIESKSAKKPGRKIFNQMMEKIKENKGPIGLLSWHPDRLARNSIDGGQIIYLIDIGKIASLRFPTFWFQPTPQGLFMLQVAFGQSKYYSDSLSENVKRGIRQKLRRGEWPSLAPFGYVNNPKTRNIDSHPTKAKIVKKTFAEYATGKYGLEALGKRLSFWGVVGKNGRPLCKATLQRMLTNKVYLGMIVRNDETYEGSFKPIVSRAIFEAVQKVLKKRSRPRKSKKSHNFPFVGLFKCGECGGMVTAQWAKGKYRYYRCTKKFGKCSQSYLQEHLLFEQLKKQLQKIALCKDWTDKMLSQVDKWEKDNVQSLQSFAQNLDEKLLKAELKLDKLIEAYLDGIIEKEIYLKKKEQLIKEKLELQQKKKDFGQKGNNWIEPTRNFIHSAHHARKLAFSKPDKFSLAEYAGFVEKIGTNRQMLDRQVSFEFARPYDLTLKYKEKCPSRRMGGRRGGQYSVSSSRELLVMSGRGESDSRRTHPMRASCHWTTPRLKISFF